MCMCKLVFKKMGSLFLSTALVNRIAIHLGYRVGQPYSIIK